MNELERENNVMLRYLIKCLGNPNINQAIKKQEYFEQWIGGYAHGRTSKNSPFIFLYSTNDKVTSKVCRVYSHDFKKLPSFIDTDIPSNAPSTDPGKGGKGYKKCPYFSILWVLAHDPEKAIQEKRFFDVLRVPSGSQTAVNHPQTAPTQRTPPPPPQTPQTPQASKTADTPSPAPDNQFAPRAPTWQSRARHATSKNALIVAIAAQFYDTDTAKAEKAINAIKNGAGYHAQINYNMAMWEAISGFMDEMKRLESAGSVTPDSKKTAVNAAKQTYRKEINY